ncbi:Glycerol dehydrogenase [compost metagenome]
MGVKDGIDDKIHAVAKATCAEGETIHNMPFPVTPESVHAAILTADLLGQQWLAR